MENEQELCIRFIQNKKDKIKDKIEMIQPEVIKEDLEKYCTRVVYTDIKRP